MNPHDCDTPNKLADEILGIRKDHNKVISLLEGCANQYGNRFLKKGKPHLSTSYLSVMEEVFDYLGWPDPLPLNDDSTIPAKRLKGIMVLSCLLCRGNLIHGDCGRGQEWETNDYHCQDCKTFHSRRTNFKTQPSLVDSDTIEAKVTCVICKTERTLDKGSNDGHYEYHEDIDKIFCCACAKKGE